MSEIKKLASQTMWYGIPSIARRFLGYLMNLSLPLFFAQPSVTADLTQIYAIIPFLNVLFTFGLETAYFRFSKEEDPKKEILKKNHPIKDVPHFWKFFFFKS